jgi:uncharacterized SAM-binding protein YcdF (DUF218 family)
VQINQEILKNAKVLWDYHRIEDTLEKVDLIFCLGSIDIRSAERATELYNQGYAKKILFSGGVAHANDLLRTTWQKPEAVVFSEAAIELGVPQKDILIEDKANNTGENITYGYKVISESGLKVNSMILVQKPYMLRRTYATFMKQWPGDKVEILVTSPQLSFEEYFTANSVENEKVINLMVGDLQRIKEYPALGFQIEQDIPEYVWNSYLYLVGKGFTKHLLK